MNILGGAEGEEKMSEGEHKAFLKDTKWLMQAAVKCSCRWESSSSESSGRSPARLTEGLLEHICWACEYKLGVRV